LLRSVQGARAVSPRIGQQIGHVSPTTAQHVRDEFGPDHTIASILDGGQSASASIDHPRPVGSRQSWPVLCGRVISV